MKTICLMALALLTSLHKSEQTAGRKQKRGSFEEFPVGSYAEGIGVPLQKTSQFTSGVDHYLPFSAVDTGNVKVDVDLPPFRPQYQQQNVAVTASADHVPQILSNSIDKPVQEPQEYIPPSSIGTAIIPQMPPPAVPVNAVASNVPSNQGATFLGSGSLGVVDLGNGAYALGSGSIGYSNMRSNPRPSIKSPLFPPVQAAPNLIPAAVPSSIPPPANPLPAYDPVTVPVDYNDPLINYLNPAPPKDANGYEYLPPNRVGFGSPLPRLPRVKATMAFATPTALQVQQPPLPQPVPPPQPSYMFITSPGSQDVSSQTLTFGQKLPDLYSQQLAFGQK